MVSNCVLFILCLILCFLCQNNDASSETNTTDIILYPGDNYTIECSGGKNLAWDKPNVTDEEMSKWTTFIEIRASNSSILQIFNMSYPYVGFYNCYSKTEDESFTGVSVYIFVNDSDHLMVERESAVHYATQYRETTIPCRPTAPDVSVTLIGTGTDHDPEVSDVPLVAFDPRLGFVVNATKDIFGIIYECVFSKGINASKYVILETISPITVLATPYIEDKFHNHTDVGETLTLYCILRGTSHAITFNWITPKGIFNAKNSSKPYSVKRPEKIRNNEYLLSELIIESATVQDTGLYTCNVSDKQGHMSSTKEYFVVHDINSCFLEMEEINKQEVITEEAGMDIEWIVKIRGHPKPTIKLLSNKDQDITKDVLTYFDDNERAVIQIKNISLKDNGTYTLQGNSSRQNRTKSCPARNEYKLQLNVISKPYVMLNTSKFYVLNNSADVSCTAFGNPLPRIEWNISCSELPCFRTSRTKINSEVFKITSVVKVDTSQNGYLSCIATNSFGNLSVTKNYFVSDVPQGFAINNFDNGSVVNNTNNTVFVALGYPLSFTCAVSPEKSKIMDIFKENELVNKKGGFNVVHLDTMSNKTTITKEKAKLSDGGIYSCRIKDQENGLYEYQNVTFIVKDPEPPRIWMTNLTKPIKILTPNIEQQLFCKSSGLPKPYIKWYKDKTQLFPTNRIRFSNDGQILKFTKMMLADEGIYRCVVSNDVGEISEEAVLTLDVEVVTVTTYYYITVFIGLLLTFAILYILIKTKKEKALKRELKLLGLQNFHEGNPERLNPEIGIDDQAELLPYSKKWEFPKEKLKFGKQLGSGAFGVVIKAEARGILDNEEVTVVAVKMVKKDADQTYIKALASELKIMAHLGKHINVVNLLGACTKNVAKRELLVIVEFCRFGNLQNFLFKHRRSFINQVDANSGKIDFSIGADILERSYSLSSDHDTGGNITCSAETYNCSEITSTGTQMTSLSDSSNTHPWRSNYRGDYKFNSKPVTTKDLITWSFQVARGMEYLASRKVLHGDLAARNILLAEKNIVKICDFGLAKTMYNDENYKKKGNSPLPVKWMAIESIRDKIFSTQSDIWSFGIVLWELFSLARTPYPGIEADERLYYKLLGGYRMELPLFAPKEMYKIMLDCWHSNPLARPSFTELSERIGALLEECVVKYYVDLNDPYLFMNNQRDETEDYLAMLNSPTFDVLSAPSPHYVNESAAYETPTTIDVLSLSGSDGYLIMEKNLNACKKINTYTNIKHATDDVHELQPMLHHNDIKLKTNDLDYLTPIEPINSVSNPTYNLKFITITEDRSLNI